MSLPEFLDTLDFAMEDQYNGFVEMVTALEIGVNRALVVASGKKLPPMLPFADFRKSVQTDVDADIWWKRPTNVDNVLPEVMPDG